MFWALYWALGFSAVGALFLRFWANQGITAEGHGLIWCIGASVNRLLPVVTLKKEFAEFFDNPALNKFTPLQDFSFTILGVLGWLLGVIVVAAIAAITHGP